MKKVNKVLLGGFLALAMSVSANAGLINAPVNDGDMFFGCVSGNNSANDCQNNASVMGVAVDNDDDVFNLTGAGADILIELLFTFNPVIALDVDVGGQMATLNAANSSMSFLNLTSPIAITIDRDGGGRIEYKVTVTSASVPLPATSLLFLMGLTGIVVQRQRRIRSS